MPATTRLHNLLVSAFVALPLPLGLQAQAPRVSVRGVAFDGLRNQPLRDARVMIVGGNRFTTTDARGRFQFDSVIPGTHTFAMQHAALDSLGFNGFSTRATVTSGREEVRIALPSFETFWRAECGGPVPENAGFVYGTIRNAEDMRPVANARVEVSWSDMVLHNKGRAREVIQRVSRGETRSDSTGSYAACGVAAAHWIRIRAIGPDSSQSSFVDLAPSPVRIQRRDLVVGRVSAADSSSRGTIVGLVTDSDGRMFAQARVILDGVAEVRTGDDGRFILPRVAPGTRQIEVTSIGLVPITTTVDVPARDTASISVQFAAPVTLSGMKVVGNRTGRVLADEFTARRKLATGYTMDSVEISRFQNLPTMLATIPSVVVYNRQSVTMPTATGRCAPDIRIDGVEAGFGHIVDLLPSEVAGIEVYNRALMVPAQFARAGHPPECGMILVWTKYGFRNR